MKKTAIYILIFFVSFAYNYETISYFSKITSTFSSSREDDFQGKEKDSESKETDEKTEKNEKFSFSTDQHSKNGHLLSFHVKSGNLNASNNHNLSSDDYSQVVYSPPEVI